MEIVESMGKKWYDKEAIKLPRGPVIFKDSQASSGGAPKYGKGLESDIIEALFKESSFNLNIIANKNMLNVQTHYAALLPSARYEHKDMATKIADRISRLSPQQRISLKKMSPASRQFWLESIDVYGGRSRLETYTFPYDTCSLGENGPGVRLNFGHDRSSEGKTSRSHAGIDIFPSSDKDKALEGIPIHAIADGYAYAISGGFVNGSRKKDGTPYSVDALLVRNLDGSVVLYGELKFDSRFPSNIRGSRSIPPIEIKQGEIIGYTSKMDIQTMLHIEIYTGELGDLTHGTEENTPYVNGQRYNSQPYQRRADLVDPSIVEAPINPILHEGMKVRLINGNGDVYNARIESNPLIFWGEEDEGFSLFANFVLENPSQELEEALYLCDFYQGEDKVYPSADFDADRFEFDFDGDGAMETFYREFFDGAVVYKCEKKGEVIFSSDDYPFSFMSGKDGLRHVESTYGPTKFLGVRFLDFNDDGIYEFVIFARTDNAYLEFDVYDLYDDQGPVLSLFVPT